MQTHMASQHHVDMGSPPSRSASRGLLLDSPLSRSPFPMHSLACIYCTKDAFPSMEALQLHVQAMHGEASYFVSLRSDALTEPYQLRSKNS